MSTSHKKAQEAQNQKFCASCAFLWPILEADLAGELDAARVVGDAVVDATEDARGDQCGRIIKRRVVQNITRIDTELESYLFRNSEPLRKRRIPLEVSRSEEEISPGISD